MKKFIITISIFSLFSMPALAVHWKNIFNATSSEGGIEAYIDTHRVKTRHYKGDKLITFWLKLIVENHKGTAKAVSHYEVNCNNRDAYFLERNLKLTNKKGQSSTTTSDSKEEVKGKDYQDLQNVLNMVCDGKY